MKLHLNMPSYVIFILFCPSVPKSRLSCRILQNKIVTSWHEFKSLMYSHSSKWHRKCTKKKEKAMLFL